MPPVRGFFFSRHPAEFSEVVSPHHAQTKDAPLPATMTAEQIPGGYVVKDANGQSLAYVYGPLEPS